MSDAIEDVAAILNNLIHYGSLTKARVENNLSTVLRVRKSRDSDECYRVFEGQSKSVMFALVWYRVPLPCADLDTRTLFFELRENTRVRGMDLAARFSDSGDYSDGFVPSGEVRFEFEAGGKSLLFACEDRDPTYYLRSVMLENMNPRDEDIEAYKTRWWKFW